MGKNTTKLTISIPITGPGGYGLSEQAVRFAGEAEIELMHRMVDRLFANWAPITYGNKE